MNKHLYFFVLFMSVTLVFTTYSSSHSQELAFFSFGKKKELPSKQETFKESPINIFKEQATEDKKTALDENFSQAQNIEIPLNISPNNIDAFEKEIYRLGAGDKIRLTVFGEEDLSGEFEVDGSGTVSLPLIGTIKTSGLSTRELENLCSDKLSKGYLIEPRVSIEVLNFRPFFILGEVNQPGSYPYVSGMTVLNAVALAGGFTHRANREKFLLKRGENTKEFKSDVNSRVLPGDLLKVQERFF